MDEISLLKRFRDQIPTEDEVARVAVRAQLLDAVKAAHPRGRLRSLRWGLAALARVQAAGTRSHRRMIFSIAAGAFVLLAGAGYAVIREFAVGDPAPEQVRMQEALFRHPGSPVPPLQDPGLNNARVAAVLNSSVGKTYLFSSVTPNRVCGSIWTEGDRADDGRLNISSFCGPSSKSTYQAKFYAPYFFAGHAGDRVARVAVLVAKQTVYMPMTNRWFFVELRDVPAEFISYDRGGGIVEQTSLSNQMDLLRNRP